MDTTGDYRPSAFDFVADQVRLYEATGGREGDTLEGKPVVILTTRGRRTGAERKSPLMRVEHDGRYAVVASMGGAPRHPVWYLNLVADPMVRLQDGARVMELRARTATPEERREWWPRATAAWPAYDDYQQNTEREIPVVILEPVS
ncbi:MAG TPA: nitroreductase family deazaflavin-dependent oxidoreductase [Acidimicrobiales bacterium]|nr:nitroreductase family deazaflavin-dependent oxidoreductase [Acidimicrobiales bacterium]